MRKNYLDNIRWCTIVLVVFFHVFFFFHNIGLTGIFPGWGEYQPGDPVRIEAVYEYAVYPWFMTLLFVVAGIAAYYALQKKSTKEFMAERRNKLLVPSTLGVLLFGFIPGSIVSNASAGDSIKDAPAFVKYIIYTLSGIGALWFLQVLFICSLLLLLVRKIVIKIHKEERIIIITNAVAYIVIAAVFFLLWGSSKVLNTPMVESYRFGIYICAFLLGYYVFSQDKIMVILKKWRFVTTIAAIASGVLFITRAYGSYYGTAAGLSTWYANLFTYFMILAVFGMFQVYGNQRTKVTEYLNRISFSVYVLHIPLFLIALKIMSEFNLPLGLKYVVLVITGFIITPLAGLLVERIPIVRYLILGIKKPVSKKS